MAPAELEGAVAHLQALVARLCNSIAELIEQAESTPEPHPLVRIVHMLAGEGR